MMMAAMWEGWKGRSIEMDKRAAENVALALENVAMKQIVDSVTNPDNEPQYHAEGMGCGLEDRGITDRYDACRYGWDEAMERVYGEVIPCSDELDFSATDVYLAGLRLMRLPLLWMPALTILKLTVLWTGLISATKKPRSEPQGQSSFMMRWSILQTRCARGQMSNSLQILCIKDTEGYWTEGEMYPARVVTGGFVR